MTIVPNVPYRVDEKAVVEFVGWGSMKDKRRKGDDEALVQEGIEDADDVESQHGSQ